ncbi:MAG: fibronectin type III domain-containing protein, partial [Bacteroidales bacterium]
DIGFTENVEILGTGSNLTTSLVAEKYFRCLVTCTFSSESEYSTPLLVSLHPVSMCYCTPPNPSSGCSNDHVASVSLDLLNDVGQTCTPVYEDRSPVQNAIPNLYPSQVIEMSVGVGNGGTEHVGVWIDFNQSGTFDADEFFALGSGNNVTVTNNITIPVDALTGNTKMRVRSKYNLAFSGSDACAQVSYGSTRDYLVNITDPPTCMAPTGLDVSDIAATSATISCEESVSEPGDVYQLYYNTTGVAPDESSVVISLPVEITSSLPTGDILDPETEYFVWLRANCGEGDLSYWVGPLSFTTLCLPFTDLPYTENFDTYGTGSDAFPDCWERPVTYNSYPYIVSAYSVSSPNSLRFQSLTTEATYAVSPAFAEDIHNLRVSFQLKAESITSSGNIELGVMSDPFDISTFETVATIQPENTNFNSYVFDLYTTTLSGENMHIAFRHNSNSSIYYYWLDDFVVDLSPSCVEPANFSLGTVTPNSALVQWNPLSTEPDNGYDLYFSLNNTAPTETSMPTYNTDEDSFLIDGLDEETDYYVWLRTNCSDTDQSEWTGPIHIFTGYCTPTNTSTSYWLSSVTTTGGITNISNTNIPSQAGGYGNFSATHSCSNFEGQATTINLAQNSSTGYFYCWIDWNKNMQFDTDELIFGTNSYSSAYQGNINIPAGTEPGEYRMRVANSWSGAVPNACTGSSNGQFHDYTFIVIDPPTCYPPIGLTVGTQTVSTATITWDDYNESPENGYEVYYSTTNTTPDDSETDIIEVEVGVQTLTIDELEIETDYYVWVRANCNNADQSDWTGPLHIYTGYCIPTNTSTSYWISSLTTTGGITNISHTGITSQPGGYGDFSAIHSCSNVEGQPTMINFAQNTSTGYYFCWIDWNKDMQFDATERIIAATSSYSSTYQGTINIPAGTEPGEYRMRVANSYLYEITDACTGSGYGQYFDYTFVVVEPANNETDILTYSFEEQIAPATIDNVEHKVYVTVA